MPFAFLIGILLVVLTIILMLAASLMMYGVSVGINLTGIITAVSAVSTASAAWYGVIKWKENHKTETAIQAINEITRLITLGYGPMVSTKWSWVWSCANIIENSSALEKELLSELFSEIGHGLFNLAQLRDQITTLHVNMSLARNIASCYLSMETVKLFDINLRRVKLIDNYMTRLAYIESALGRPEVVDLVTFTKDNEIVEVLRSLEKLILYPTKFWEVLKQLDDSLKQEVESLL